MNDPKHLLISICTYNNGAFDVIFQDPDTYEEITLSGQQSVKGEQFDFINRIAPACVFTRYARITPEN